jgi:hypothetical protein
MWVPDVQFQDLIDVSEVAVLFKLRPNGEMFYSRHLKVTVMQPILDLSKYPGDVQHVMMRYESDGLTGGVMDLQFSDPPVHYVQNDDGHINFEMNPVWYVETFVSLITLGINLYITLELMLYFL